jgi:outer membrane protein TolC
VGVTFSYPLGRSYEEASLARAEIEHRRAAAVVASLEVRAIEEIRVSARLVDSTAERIEATRAGADLAQQRLTAEQRRFEVGMSTSFLVTQAQRDLVQSQVGLLQAMLDHQSALIEFEVLQQAPSLAGGAGVGVSGASVVALPPSFPRGMSSGIAGNVF